MTAHLAPLSEFLRGVRRAGARRALAGAVASCIVGALALWLVVLLGVMATQRGDLGQIAVFAGAAILVLSVSVGAVRSWLLAHGSALLAARTIARARQTVPPQFAHELLAATELDDLRQQDYRHSPDLAARYVADVALRCRELRPASVLPPFPWMRFVRSVVLLAATLMAVTMTSTGREATNWLIDGEDARPPQPPVPLWSSLDVVLHYPEYTTRTARRVPNPSGPLRAPLGTRIELHAKLTQPTPAARVIVVYDSAELVEAPPPTTIDLARTDEDRSWTGSFELAAAGTWTMVLLDDADASTDAAVESSAPSRLEVEVDAPPELELLPLPADQREPSELESVDLRFRARDDFGLATATLVYELPDGATHRLPAGDGAGRRSWNHRYTWDLSSVPIERRSEITYWLEVRDNDPGLGLVPLADPPGKAARSARHKLFVRDEESEHAKNVATLRGIRDDAVDLLAHRLTAGAMTQNAALTDDIRRAALLAEARGIHMLAQRLLTIISDTVDALSIDRMVPERDVRVLVEIHGRLHALFRQEASIHAEFPPGNEVRRPQDVAWILARLARHNAAEVTALEDDIIRLDDLVDGQIIADLERLLARLQASQQKLLELLEKLAAGDETVRPQIEQLEQRIREDLRRLSAARAQLRKEVGDEYMNLDAFKAMEARVQHQNVMGSLERGDTEDALRAARETLDEISSLRDAVAQRVETGEDTRLSPEEEAKMMLLRELGRLKDDQGQITREAGTLEQAWRTAVDEADPDTEVSVNERARELLERVSKINDARLSRDARRGYEDARDQLEALERLAKSTDPDVLALYDAARLARQGLDRAQAGAERGEAESRSLEQMSRRAQALEERLLEQLPRPDDTLSESDKSRSNDAGRTQLSLQGRLEALVEDPQARDVLPPAGHQALRAARRAMTGAEESLQQLDPLPAGDSSREATDAIQRAIDSLRQGGTPPPTSNQADEASTEAERDRSLRDALMDAMRENPPDGFDEPIERYYEELLQ